MAAYRSSMLLLVFAAARVFAATNIVTIQFDRPAGAMNINHMALGQGGLSDRPMWGDRVTEISALKPSMVRLFIQEYFKLLPQKGRYHFDSLDRSVDTILATGAKPLMCICFKPEALFPVVNHDIVEPNDYAAWEELVFQLVTHYRLRGAGIRYWEVANEPDLGESGGCPYRFRPDSYLRYYAHTAAAILRANPAARVGGPAVASVRSPLLPALIDGAATNNLPLHFISWHIYSSSPSAVRETIDHTQGLLKKHPALKVETFLDEWNMDLMDPPLDPRFQPCYVAEVIWQMKEGGLDYSCYYHIRDWYVDIDQFTPFMSRDGAVFMARWWNRMPQFDGLFDYQNQVRPAYFAFKLLSRLRGQRLPVESSNRRIHGLASYDDLLRTYNVLLWNFSTAAEMVDMAPTGIPRQLRHRHITLDAATASGDENARLRPDPFTSIGKGGHCVVELGAYGVQYWSFE